MTIHYTDEEVGGFVPTRTRAINRRALRKLNQKEIATLHSSGATFKSPNQQGETIMSNPTLHLNKSIEETAAPTQAVDAVDQVIVDGDTTPTPTQQHSEAVDDQIYGGQVQNHRQEPVAYPTSALFVRIEGTDEIISVAEYTQRMVDERERMQQSINQLGKLLDESHAMSSQVTELAVGQNKTIADLKREHTAAKDKLHMLTVRIDPLADYKAKENKTWKDHAGAVGVVALTESMDIFGKYIGLTAAMLGIHYLRGYFDGRTSEAPLAETIDPSA